MKTKPPIFYPVLLALVFGLACSRGAAQSIMEIEPLDLLTHTWDGVGDVQRSSSVCIRASRRGRPENYRVRGEQSRWVAGSGFQLSSTGWPISRLPVSLEFDSSPQSFTLPLERGGPYAGDYAGSTVAGCDNARVDWFFRATELERVPAGTYTDGLIFGFFQSIVLHAAWARDEGRAASSNLRFNMIVPPLVSISGLSDIVLKHDGVSDRESLGQESYCVWSNTGSYSLTATSTTSDPALPGSFAVADGARTIPYSLRVAGDTKADQGELVGNGGTVGPFPGHTQARDCGGADNASLQVRFSSADLRSATQGVYSATLVLRVEPN